MILDLDKTFSDFWQQALPKGAAGYTIHDDDLTVELLEFTYDQPQVVHSPNLVASTTFSNGTDATASQTFTDTKSTSSTFTWSVQEGLKLGASTSFSVSAPFLAEGKVEASIELSLAATQEQSTTKSQLWSYEATIPVPPHSQVVASAIISMAEYSPAWRARVAISGRSYITVPGSTGRKSVPAYAVLRDLPGVRVDGEVVHLHASGRFSGAQGLSVEVKTRQSPLALADALALVEDERAGAVAAP